MEVFYCFEGQVVQTMATVRDIFDDLFAHARFPEFLEVVGDFGHGFILRIAGEEEGDLVRHVNHVLGFHG